MKRFFLTAILVLVVMIFPLNCYACTGVYVGRDASADGTIILAKSNDYQAVWPNHVAVMERMENAPGRSMPVDNGKTVFAPLPATTYRYTSTPWEVLDELKPISPLEVTLDPEAYFRVPVIE